MASPWIAIETDTETEAECIESSLRDFTFARNGLRLTLTGTDRDDTILVSVLNALEDSLTHNRLRPVTIEVEERRYVLFARADDPLDGNAESTAG